MSWANRKQKQFVCVECNATFEKKALVAKLCSQACRTSYLNKYHVNRRKSSIEETLRTVVAGCRSRAKRKNLECDITVEFMLELLEAQQGKCAMTGQLLTSSAANTKENSMPTTVSIDRINPKIGYITTNVRLVTYMYNSCKGRWTDDIVVQMCKDVLNNARTC